MKLFRKVVDERQELEMMRVERVGFWVLFFGLVVAITVQVFVFKFDMIGIAGEFIVLILGATCSLIGYIRRGSWDYFTKPGMKSYLIYSAVGSMAFGVFMSFLRLFRFDATLSEYIKIFAINSAIYIAILFPTAFILLWIMGFTIKKQQAKLQHDFEEETQG